MLLLPVHGGSGQPLPPLACRTWNATGEPGGRGRSPGWRRRRGRRLWYVRGRDCISKDPPFSPRHHHHSSAASPTARARAAAAAAAASNLPLPPPHLPGPPLPRGAHPHIRGNLPPAPPTFKCSGRHLCTEPTPRPFTPPRRGNRATCRVPRPAHFCFEEQKGKKKKAERGRGTTKSSHSSPLSGRQLERKMMECL